mmetsp:Transcript_16872/g.20605  ORF Transcript_16872/g.20605 Transcript_16872/m.20605 type:complete len:241 (-) Transcript_16872:83-805(-)
MHLKNLIRACLLISSVTLSAGWSSTSSSTSRSPTNNLSRQAFFEKAKVALTSSAILTIATTITPLPSIAASTPSPKDLEKLQKGHSRVVYLLNNWDSITEICGKGVMSDLERKQVVRTDGGGGGVCEKTPLKVQDYLGYKSTEDPLFRADKLMVKAAQLVDPDELEDYLDVVEKYREKADQGAMMAYTSSWGEANPNGGKDIIEEYLLDTKAEVEKTEPLLRSVLGYLKLDVLPPSASLK